MPHRHSSLKLITPPAIEPVSIDEFKLFANIDFTDYDTLIPELLETARDYCEGYTGRAFIKQTWELGLDAFPHLNCYSGYANWNHNNWFQSYPHFSTEKFPINPVIRICSIKYMDTNNVERTLSDSVYSLDNRSLMARLTPKYNQCYPDTVPIPNSVIIRFEAGYGCEASDIPAKIKTCIKMYALNIFSNRVPNSVVQTYPIEIIDNLLFSFRIQDI